MIRNFLLQYKEFLLNDRKGILDNVTELSSKNCNTCQLKQETHNRGILVCRNCTTLKQLQQCGDKLTENLILLRIIRKAIIGGNHMAELTVEAYKDLKSQGLTDKEIQEKFGIHVMKLYNFKKENGLIKTRKQKELDPGTVQTEYGLKTEQFISSDDYRELAQKIENLEAVLEAIRKENDVLRKENESLHNELWTDRITCIFNKQKEFDAIVIEKHGLNMEQLKNEQLLALIVEIAETANEEQSFKFWKTQKEVDRDKLLEELVDILHMMASVGTQRGFEDLKIEIVKLNTPTEQILDMIFHLMPLYNGVDNILQNAFNRALNLFIGLTQMFSFSWQEVEAAYLKKHAKNIERQQNGY